VSTGDALLLVGAALLVAVAGLFAAAEAAFSRVSRVRAEELVRDSRPGAHRALQVANDPATAVNLVLLLRLICEVAGAVLFLLWSLDELGRGWQAVLLTLGVMVLVDYVYVGVALRTVGRQYAERVVVLAAPVALSLARPFGPLIRLLIALGNAIVPGKGSREGPFASEAELRALVDLAEESRVIESGERQMIHSVFELGDTIAREVMVPRTDMVFIEKNKTLRQAMSLALRSGFSRIPVVGEDEDDVVGMIYLRDLAKRTYEYRDGESVERVESLMRPATFVPDSKPVDELLREMQAKRVHAAVVVDEYGGTAGLITIEDILEEIVGEITDEHDLEEAPIEELGEDCYRVTARLPIEELAELFGVSIPINGVETVGGLLASELGRVPIPGARVEVSGLLLVAEAAAGRRHRIGTVLVSRQLPAASETHEVSEPETLDQGEQVEA
jgi:CBS domain containing-hemolysin-like protein